MVEMCGGEGHKNVAAYAGKERRKQQSPAPVVLPHLQGLGLVRQRSLLLRSIFVSFDASKEMGLCGQEQTEDQLKSYPHKQHDLLDESNSEIAF